MSTETYSMLRHVILIVYLTGTFLGQAREKKENTLA